MRLRSLTVQCVPQSPTQLPAMVLHPLCVLQDVITLYSFWFWMCCECQRPGLDPQAHSAHTAGVDVNQSVFRHWWLACSCHSVTKSCPTPRDPTDCSI